MIGSNHTTNEENFFLAKFARQGWARRTSITTARAIWRPSSTRFPARANALATTDDLYTRQSRAGRRRRSSAAASVPGFQARANFRHHSAHIYAVTAGPVREDNQAVASVRVQKGGELAGVESLRDKLKAEGDLVDRCSATPFRVTRCAS